ncbi:DNA-binding NarL/FixJ family response regulator [Blastococcus colisei]|uniref:DNA-binding NarL/FixJ family response regulator n=1 Tax=Blastococcus colisei TaxID=1564162 RepID=A0A543P1K5_9ACTN|nr:DNA-binding NarL/FixJ family response regulator [Blastococcus colisei]
MLLGDHDPLTRDLAADVLKTGGCEAFLCPRDESLAAAARRVRADVVLLDVSREPSPEAVERTVLSALESGARALLIADGASREQVLAGLLAGASGQVQLWTTSPQRFLRAVRQVAEGSAALHPDVAAAVLSQWRAMRSLDQPKSRSGLSTREVEILSAAADGLTNQAVARRLNLSARTVENHKARIFAKLGARNQAEAVSIAIRQGLLPNHEVGS